MNIDSVITRTLGFERSIRWLYKDTAGVPTTGVGRAIFALEDSLALPWRIARGGVAPYVEAASPEAIERDYAAIRYAPAGKEAEWYEPLTACRLNNNSIREMLQSDIMRIAAQIALKYPPFDTLPGPVQEALFDIGYNVGPAGLMKFHRMLAAVEARNWTVAAMESRRPQVGAERNECIAGLLRSAAVSSLTT